jgi:polyphosphate glucokinase
MVLRGMVRGRQPRATFILGCSFSREGADAALTTLRSVVSRPCDSSAVLAVDIGASSIKLCLVDDNGERLSDVTRVPTPYPCSPTALVEFVSRYVAESGCARVGVGFPGAMIDGRVVEPGNLSRANGFTSPIDPELHDAWITTNLQEALRQATQVNVRVVNDATLAALGCCVGDGRELVFTLGTGFGIALVVDGTVVPIRDVGSELFEDAKTYDEALGDHARASDEARWCERLVRAVSRFIDEFFASVVHFSGGNSRRVDLATMSGFDATFIVNDNDTTLSGAAKLFGR